MHGISDQQLKMLGSIVDMHFSFVIPSTSCRMWCFNRPHIMMFFTKCDGQIVLRYVVVTIAPCRLLESFPAVKITLKLGKILSMVMSMIRHDLLLILLWVNGVVRIGHTGQPVVVLF